MNRSFGLLAAAAVAATPFMSSAQTSAPAPAPAEQKVTITPYGFILTQAFFNDGPFAAKDFPGQVLTNGEGGSFMMSARGSRMGFKIGLPDDPLTGAHLSAVTEFDFKGGQIPNTNTCTTTQAGTTFTTACALSVNSNAWYNGIMRLRLAYAQAMWGGPDFKFTLIAGQDWSVVAPVNGTSLAWGYDPIFYQAGNLWKRGPQVKAGIDVGGPVGASLWAAATTPADLVTANNQQTGGTDYGAGNRSRMPGFEGRAAVNVKSGKTKVVEIGVSAAMQERRYALANNTPRSFADTTVRLGVADATFNLPFVTVVGEAFLNDGYSDAFQGIESTGGNPAQTTQFPTPAVEGSSGYNIGSKGFFVEAVLKPIPQIWIPVGYGVEKLRYDSKTLGIAAATRTKNSQFHAGVLFNMTNPWQFGVEMVHTISGYGRAAPVAISKDADQFAVTSKLNF